jgi:hypothetical protein
MIWRQKSTLIEAVASSSATVAPGGRLSHLARSRPSLCRPQWCRRHVVYQSSRRCRFRHMSGRSVCARKRKCRCRWWPGLCRGLQHNNSSMHTQRKAVFGVSLERQAFSMANTPCKLHMHTMMHDLQSRGRALPDVPCNGYDASVAILPHLAHRRPSLCRPQWCRRHVVYQSSRGCRFLHMSGCLVCARKRKCRCRWWPELCKGLQHSSNGMHT